MAVTQTLLSMDSYFKDSDGPKIIVNDIDYYRTDDMVNLNSNLMTIYEEDVFDTIPRCDCGNLKDNYNIDKVCRECGTSCKEAFAKVQPLLWLKTMYVDIPFMNPMFYLMYREVFPGKTDYVRWMSDPRYNPPVRLPLFMVGVMDIIGVRSYTNMVNNIEKVLNYLYNHTSFKDPTKQTYIMNLLELYRVNKSIIYSTYLPVVNKKLFVMEKTAMGNFTNLTVADIIDTVMLWIKYTSDSDLTKPKAEKAMVNALHKLSNLYDNYFDAYLFKKPGILRKHIFGARVPFTFRSVIISITGPHDYNEIHIPWSIAVTVMRPQILNRLVNKYKITYKKANVMLYRAVKKYDSLIDNILSTLISESPYTTASGKHGIPAIVNRNQ